LKILRFFFISFLLAIIPTISHAAPTPTASLEAATGWTLPELQAHRQRMDEIRARPARQATQTEVSWTVIVYMAADNNLEKYAIGDINDMEFTGGSEDVNVVVQVDRAEGYDDSNEDWTDTRRYLIQEDIEDMAGIEVNSELVGELDETNTGDPATLVDFATWAIKTYPADQYALIIWDHGGSWFGAAADNSADGDMLTLPELDGALTTIRQETQLEKFEFIGFDACLMGALEVYQTLVAHTYYAIASPELVPGFGWNYADVLLEMVDNPDITVEDLGYLIIDSFVEFYSRREGYSNVILGMVDLEVLTPLNEAINAFTLEALLNPADLLTTLVAARNGTTVYGGLDNPAYTDVWAAVELFQLMDLFAKGTENTALAESAAQVVALGRDVMTYSQGTGILENLPGMSVYFPRNQRFYEDDNHAALYQEKTMGLTADWQLFLAGFYLAASGSQGTTSVALGGSASNGGLQVAVATNNPLAVRSAFYVTVTAPDGLPMLVSYQKLTSGSGQQQTNWQPQIPVIRQGNHVIPVLALDAGAGQNLVNGIYTDVNGESFEAQMLIDAQTGAILSAWGIQRFADGVMPYEIQFQTGDRFRPYWISLDENGDFVFRPANDEILFEEDMEPMSLEAADAEPGSYEVGMLVEDVNGGSFNDVAEIEINDAGELILPQDLPSVEDIEAVEVEDWGEFPSDVGAEETLPSANEEEQDQSENGESIPDGDSSGGEQPPDETPLPTDEGQSDGGEESSGEGEQPSPPDEECSTPDGC